MIENERYSLTMEEWSVVFEARKPSPVTISCPHDGLLLPEFSGLFEARKTGWWGRDLRVWRRIKDILLLTDVNSVRGLMPRALIDYNRAWPKGINYYPRTQKEVHTALDDAKLLNAYEYYHSSIDRILKESTTRFGREHVLLLDVHGFEKQPSYAPASGLDLILGTGNRASVPHGNIDEKLAHYMTERGYNVFLPEDMSIGPEEDWYSADFTTRHHSEKRGINVIQIEIASRFRIRGENQAGQKLSIALANFIKSNCLVET